LASRVDLLIRKATPVFRDPYAVQKARLQTEQVDLEP